MAAMKLTKGTIYGDVFLQQSRSDMTSRQWLMGRCACGGIHVLRLPVWVVRWEVKP
jgi:hypothetical protein